MPGFTDKTSLISSMISGNNLTWDIIIIGGGITGAGVLREAVRRGYRALLIEQNDFSWGTSSRSSKMIHGGLRYLAAGDYKLQHQQEQQQQDQQQQKQQQRQTLCSLACATDCRVSHAICGPLAESTGSPQLGP